MNILNLINWGTCSCMHQSKKNRWIKLFAFPLLQLHLSQVPFLTLPWPLLWPFPARETVYWSICKFIGWHPSQVRLFPKTSGVAAVLVTEYLNSFEGTVMFKPKTGNLHLMSLVPGIFKLTIALMSGTYNGSSKFWLLQHSVLKWSLFATFTARFQQAKSMEKMVVKLCPACYTAQPSGLPSTSMTTWDHVAFYPLLGVELHLSPEFLLPCIKAAWSRTEQTTTVLTSPFSFQPYVLHWASWQLRQLSRLPGWLTLYLHLPLCYFFCCVRAESSTPHSVTGKGDFQRISLGSWVLGSQDKLPTPFLSLCLFGYQFSSRYALASTQQACLNWFLPSCSFPLFLLLPTKAN